MDNGLFLPRRHRDTEEKFFFFTPWQLFLLRIYTSVDQHTPMLQFVLLPEQPAPERYLPAPLQHARLLPIARGVH